MYKAGNKLWHTDSSFKYLPGLASLLHARTVVPLGGHTEFADQRAAYDALPAAMKAKLEGLVAEHCIVHSRLRSGFTEFTETERRRLPPVPQMLVRTIPESGRKSLYVASHAGRIFGMPDTEGKALIDELIAHVTQRQFVHSHRWRPNEMVMWDNRCTMHRGTDFDDLRWVRDMRRVTLSDVANTCEQAGVNVDPRSLAASAQALA
jgi:alpha-ketoglutarate-dependent 2,4-dichlorophenoxyacetate dioxygenase